MVLVDDNMGHLCPCSVQDHFEAIRCIGLKMACKSKTATSLKAKMIEIWDSGVIEQHIRGTFDPVVLKVILESFSAHVSNWLLTQKRLSVEKKKRLNLISGALVNHIRGVFGLVALKII